jgi:hypothetical protein
MLNNIVEMCCLGIYMFAGVVGVIIVLLGLGYN